MKLVFAKGCPIKIIKGIDEKIKQMLDCCAPVREDAIEEATVYIIEANCAMRIEYDDGTIGYLADYLPH